jgi:type I restriction enzyme S subunit
LLALFPDRFQDSELGAIPAGWDISTIEKVSAKVSMGPFGSNIKVSTFVAEGIPVISGQHLNETMLEDNTFNFISEDHAEKLVSANVTRGDIVFTHAGNIGQVAYIPDQSRYSRYVLSQRQFFMRCDATKISPIFMTYFFRSPEGQHKLLANTTQVGVPSIARPVSYLKSIELVIPSKSLSDEFHLLVRTFHQQISVGRSEMESLTKLRDALLPKLLSGELRVPEAAAHERS